MAKDPTRALAERTPDELGEFVDDHLIMALLASDHLHPLDRQQAEDYLRDRLVAIADTWTTPGALTDEDGRRRMGRLRAMLTSHDGGE